MYKRIGKRFVAVLLIVIMMFSLSSPASATGLPTDWASVLLSLIPQAVSAVPEDIKTSFSDGIYFNGIVNTWLNQAMKYIGYYELGLTPVMLIPHLIREGWYSGMFIEPTHTVGSLTHVNVSLADLRDMCAKLQTYYPVQLSYDVSSGLWYILLTEYAIYDRNGTTAHNREVVFDALTPQESGTPDPSAIEGSILRAMPYIGNVTFVAYPDDLLPDFAPEDAKTPTAGSTEHNYYTDQSYTDSSINDNSVTTNTNVYNGGDTITTENFDYSNGTWYDNVTGTVNDIENLSYNPSTNTYTINNTYNITYEYNYTYYYNLGSSENLVQDYKFYYELPDGRSSADLTEDEIMGLSLEFDVVNYAEDRTDENTKILVPFDGSWEDIAYQGPDLRWKIGASITYKDSAAFEGALYLDGSTSHSFGFDGFFNATPFKSQGLTLQFRHYCDAFQTTSSNNIPFVVAPIGFYNSSGSSTGAPTFYIWDGALWYKRGDFSTSNAASGTRLASIPSGVWNDFTFSYFSSGNDYTYIHVYLNGVFVSQIVLSDTSYNTFVKTSYPFFGFNVTAFSVPSRLSFGDGTFDEYFQRFSASGSPDGAGYQMIDNLRLVDFALFVDTSNFIPTPVPFDTNLVYVLPDTSNLKDNTIAVQHGSTVTGYRIGGVRPTFPEEGMVWMPLEGDKIADCQIYNGSYWESVGCRIWTGERWVPAWAFNVVTLADLWDLYGGEDVDSYTEITSGSFYQWFQEQFLELKTIIQTGFDRIANALGVQTDDTDVTEPDENGNSVFTFFAFFDNLFSTDQTEEAGVVEDALDSLLALASRFVSSIRDFFAGFAVMEALSTDYFAGIADTLSAASELVSGVWEAIPTPITDVLIACFMLIVFGVLIAIFV